MTERPILFNAEMVRAILDGRKTQTRRIVNNKYIDGLDFLGSQVADEIQTEISVVHVTNCTREDDKGKQYKYTGLLACSSEYPEEGYIEIKSPFGMPGDLLWVRETLSKKKWPDYHYVVYPQVTAGTGDEDFNYRGSDYRGLVPSIHMPRWASRILLEITDIRVERVQDISEGDAIAEGVRGLEKTLAGGSDGIEPDSGYEFAMSINPRFCFENLWQSIYGDSWKRNDWVWVVEFKRIDDLAMVANQ